jgi:hypothetical protein
LVVDAVHGQSNLLEVVVAGQAAGCLTYFLYRRNEQTNENGNNGDHHQKLDECESVAGVTA